MSDRLNKLMEEKERMEKEIKECDDFLVKEGFGRTGGLVDSEGFPTVGFEKVISIRTTRNKIAMLQNDHIAVMKEIEKEMVDYFQEEQKKELQNSKENNPIINNPKVEEEKLPTPFAKVNEVFKDSPAFQAGFQANDLITQFGTCSAEHGLEGLTKVVQNSVGKQIQVNVIRDEKIKVLSLTPRQWSGKGLIGCHVIPFKN